MPARKPRAKTAPAPAPAAVPAGQATPQEVSAYLQKPLQTLANWRWLKKGPRYTKVGRDVRYDWVDVREWLRSQPSGGAPAQDAAA